VVRAIFLVAVLGAGTSCATSTVILSDPPGATVSYHGRDLGQTPLDYDSEDWLWESRKLEVSYPGYQPRNVTLRREKLNPTVAIASGAVFLFFCWPAGVGMFLAGGLDYPDEVYVRLRPARPARAPVPPPYPARPHAAPPAPVAPPRSDESSVPY